MVGVENGRLQVQKGMGVNAIVDRDMNNFALTAVQVELSESRNSNRQRTFGVRLLCVGSKWRARLLCASNSRVQLLCTGRA